MQLYCVVTSQADPTTPELLAIQILAQKKDSLVIF